tara:strand:- start:438 stop:731 length:294 start_codon:yes stop_codon:yes gene_type:complete
VESDRKKYMYQSANGSCPAEDCKRLQDQNGDASHMHAPLEHRQGGVQEEEGAEAGQFDAAGQGLHGGRAGGRAAPRAEEATQAAAPEQPETQVEKII